jgi:hypothetical protein
MRVARGRRASHGKVVGFVWDLCGIAKMAKDQADSGVSFGAYRLELGREQLWRGGRAVKSCASDPPPSAATDVCHLRWRLLFAKAL